MFYFKRIFNERKNEIEDFTKLMFLLEQKNDTKIPNEDLTLFQNFFNSMDNSVVISYQTMINIMKSNVVLMLYNIIEFTVSGLIDIIYDTIKDQNLSYVDVNDDIQCLWRETILSAMRDPNANYNTFLKKSEIMINNILKRETLILQAKDSLTGGNLDGVGIIRTLDAHGITFMPSHSNYRPEKLDYIKTKRNELAHGSISFTEALRDTAIKDISKDKDIIFSFLDDLIETVTDYQTNEKYKCAN